MSKIFLKKLKNIILIHFRVKSFLKNNHNNALKHALRPNQTQIFTHDTFLESLIRVLQL